MQVRRIATDQLRNFAGEPRQRSVPVPVERPDLPVALERPARLPVQVEPHVAQCARLALHHRTVVRMRRDVHRVRRRQRHQPLPKPRRRLRTESPVPLGPHRWRPAPWSQALRSSDPSTPISPVGQKENCRRSCAGAAREGRMCHKGPSNYGFAGTRTNPAAQKPRAHSDRPTCPGSAVFHSGVALRRHAFPITRHAQGSSCPRGAKVRLPAVQPRRHAMKEITCRAGRAI